MTWSDKEWNHICDIWCPEVSSTCTSTPPPPPKQAASEEKPSNKRAHASSSSWKQRLHWACPVFSPSWRLVLSKSLVQTSTKCQRSHQEEASRLWFLDHLLCLKWLIRTDYRNAFSLPRWNFTLLSFMHFTRLLLKHPLLNSPASFKMTRCVSIPFISVFVYPSPPTSYQGFGLKVDEFF